MTREVVEEAVFGHPGPAVAPWVERYIGYRYEGFEPGIHAGLPSPMMTFIISFGDPVDIAEMPGARQGPQRLQAFVSGLATGPARILHDGNQCGVSVELTPLGARALLGVPAGELAWYVTPVEDLLGPGTASLADQLASCPSWGERFRVLDGSLQRALARRRTTAPPPEVVEAYRMLKASGGLVAVQELADHVGWSRRHLAERFREEIGLAPKAVARVVRFDRARHLLGRASLAEVAAVCGYADQAHFTREFRELAGSTPTAWMAEEQLPYVQDPEPADVA